MSIHGRGKSVPSQWVTSSRIKACRNQNELGVELVGNGQDDGLEGHQVLSVAHLETVGVAHLAPVERDVHIETSTKTLPHHIVVGILVRREESGIVIPETFECTTWLTQYSCEHL